MIQPDELREIADRLELAQHQGDTEAIEALTALVNGAADSVPPIASPGQDRAHSEAVPGPPPTPALGTPAPASPPALLTCKVCGKQLQRQGYGPHMAKKHGGQPTSPKTQPTPIGWADDVALQVRSWGE